MVRPKHHETQIPLKNCKNQDEEQEMMASVLLQFVIRILRRGTKIVAGGVISATKMVQGTLRKSLIVLSPGELRGGGV